MPKSNPAHNALTHGLYARDTVLPWEDPEVFAAHCHAIREELRPTGALEEEAVREIADLQWRKQRLAIGYLLPYHKKAPAPELVAAAKAGIEALATHLAESAEQSGTIVATSSQILGFIKGRMSGDKTAPALHKVANDAPTIVEQAYHPTAIAQHLKVEGMIDNRVAKALARLVGLKEYKKLYATEPVNAAPPLAPPAEQTRTWQVPAPRPAPRANSTPKVLSGEDLYR